jgi:glycine/serine hydroxymethyltransferase
VRNGGIDELLRGVMLDERLNRETLNLTANESVLSNTARSLLALEVGNRYFFGASDSSSTLANPSSPFATRGLPGLTELVAVALAKTRIALGAAIVNLSCLSGVHAKVCAILAASLPGESIVATPVSAGGHFGTGELLTRLGRRFCPLPMDDDTQEVDYLALRSLFQGGAKTLYLNVSFHLRPWDLRRLRAAVGEGATIIYDASHTLGLILGGEFQDPLREGADIICGNTHKTLPGPQKGMLAYREKEFGTAADAFLDGALYSSTHAGSTAALAVTLLEIGEYGSEYARQIIRNSNALGAALDKLGGEVRRCHVPHYTENHQIHLFVDSVGDHGELGRNLASNRIAVNFDNSIGGRRYIRIGTQEVTRRGMSEADMGYVAHLVWETLAGRSSEHEVSLFARRFDRIHFSFD